MGAALVALLVPTLVPIALALICAKRAPVKAWSIAILCSMSAALPGFALLVRSLETMGIALILAFLLVAFSYGKVPPRMWPRRWEMLRLWHVLEGVTWLLLAVYAEAMSV